jgi:type I restriction enzyme M protein
MRRAQRTKGWLRDESLDDSATLPHPGILAAEIVEDLRGALAQFQEIADDLSSDEAPLSSSVWPG